MKTPCRPAFASRRQRGTYAVEFSVVFIVSFTLLYALICYGIVFTLRFGLQNAAEDGARAALRYQTSWTNRKSEAENVAKAQMPKLTLPSEPVIVAQRCQMLAGGATNCITPKCGMSWDYRCQVIVTVTVTNIRTALPPLPLFAVPDSLVGQASMLLDGKSL
jgi:Flp pilus assembly protein TadG